MRKYRLAILSILAIVLVAYGSYAAGTVFAKHYIHLGMEQRLQISGGLPENYVNKWALFSQGTAVTWYADEGVKARFVAALAKWTTAIPQLQWREATSALSADVRVVNRTDCDGPGSFVVTSWHTDSDRSARYWSKARICLVQTVWYAVTDNYYHFVALHEIGYALRLGRSL